MNGPLLIVLLLTVTALLWSVFLTLQAHEHKRFVSKSLRTPPGHWYAPPGVLVCVPCKGLDLDLADNLRCVLRQDYPKYRVRFVVDTADDPAGAVIERLMSESSVPCELLVAGTCTDSGQKVHNLRHATANLPYDVEVLVFFDSDAKPAPDAVSRFVDSCCRGQLQAATGYRWLVPRRASLANLTLASVNAAVASLFKHHGWNLIWGGGWAITRELFEKTAVADAWSGTLSDDLVVSRVLRVAAVKVVFEPGGMASSRIDVTWKEAATFLRRQFLICRCYAPLWWWATVPLMVLQPLVLFGGLPLAYVLARQNNPLWYWPLLTSGTLYAMTVLRSYWRQGVWNSRVSGSKEALRAAARFDLCAAPWSCLFAVGALLASATGRSIAWRGIHYHIGRAGRVTLLGRVPNEQQLCEMRRAQISRAARDEAARLAAITHGKPSIQNQLTLSSEQIATTGSIWTERVA